MSCCRCCSTERMTQQFRGTPFEPDLRRAIAKLSEMLPDGVSVRLDDVAWQFAGKQKQWRTPARYSRRRLTEP